MDKREARQYVLPNPPADPFLQERRPSFLGRLFASRSRTSSLSEEGSTMAIGMQRRGSIDPPDVTTITQKLQEVKKPAPTPNANELINIFT